MTHSRKGRYREKRKGIEVNERIAEAIKSKVQDGTITCLEAHTIASTLGVSPQEVGANIDLLDVRIIECQLGLFGYEGKTKIPPLPKDLNPQVESEVKSSLVNGKLPCKTAWEIADKFKLERPVITSLCESLNIKIGNCQLGAF